MTEKNVSENKGKFSLVELLMIIMVVGIIFTFIVPMRSANKRREKVNEAIVNLQYITKQVVSYANQLDEDGIKNDYPIALSEVEEYFDINDNPKWDVFSKRYNRELKGKYFTYAIDDSSMFAKSTNGFGKAGLEIHYYFPNGPFIVSGKEARKYIDPNWLP